ncbi:MULTISPECIES: FAD-binding oxidoreductase [Methylomonas]|uniref:FAD-binding oxidoreductase n=1 Tax=Methylomonas TaxID=416 RepID=UPI0012329440|nr:FAD-binding oxidoreductase [Methylomonas rhizoryzae]
MPAYSITLGNRVFAGAAGESVLETLLRAKVEVAHGCRQGVCQSCMMRSLDGPPPVEAQTGLKDVLRQNGHFLSCMCYPQTNMQVSLGNGTDVYQRATVLDKQNLNTEILLLTLGYETPFEYRAGQFVKLRRQDGLTRSYSIANQRDHSNSVNFHIRRLAGGRFSEWLHREVAIGDSMDISAAQGSCYYLPGNTAQNLLLIGTGSGLAPLYGILREALQQGHRGRIRLYHGSSEISGLYWIDEMRRLAREHANLSYTPCVSRGDVKPGFAKGRANDVAMAELPNLNAWRVYLCGHPDMVMHSKRQAYLQGAGLQDIYSDAFHLSS